MARILGLGGLFLKSADPDRARTWYRDVLGLAVNDYGGFDFLHTETAAAAPAARTVFSHFAADSDYFDPSDSDHMINFIVDDLDAILGQARLAGVTPVQPSETHAYGRFAWLVDPDGRKVELWQPTTPAG